MFCHGIENDQQLSHAGDQRHLWNFPCCPQPLIGGPDHGIPFCGHQRGHVEHRAHGGTATPDPPPSAETAAVPVQGRDADERRNLFTVQVAKFW